MNLYHTYTSFDEVLKLFDFHTYNVEVVHTHMYQ